MPEQLVKFIQPVKARWDAINRQQRIKLIAAVLVVLFALVVTVYFVTRTTYVPFANNLDPNTLVQIDTALNDAGIKHRKTNNSTAIEVDEKRLGDARVETSTNPSLSTLPFTFQDALSASGMSSTTTVQREAMLRAKKYDLSQALKGFNGVIDAVVELYIPERVRFLTTNGDVSRASVRLDVSRDLSRNDGTTIARFLSRSVEGLEMENIEVLDNNFNILYSGLQDTSGTGAGNIAEMQEQERNLLIKQVRNLFQTMFNEVQIAPNLIFDNNIATSSEVSTITSPVTGESVGVPLEEHTSSSTVQGSPTGDVPGTEANDQTTGAYETGGSSTYKGSEKESDTTYGYNQSKTVSQSGPGSYLRSGSSITVSLFRYTPYYQKNMMDRDKSFTQADWDDFKNTTTEQALTNDPNLDLYTEWVAAATGFDKEKVRVSILEVPIFYDYEQAPVEIQQIIMFAVLALLILMLAFGLIRRTKPEEEEEIEPELSVEDLLVSTQLEEAKDEAEKLEEIDYFKDSEIKKQIEKFVTERPEAVSQLLRNWLNNEEW